MKRMKYFSLLLTATMMTFMVSAQKLKTESLKVSGECGMCKKKIETAARQAGATAAFWSPETKLLKVTYSLSGGGLTAIQQAIANSGYDAPAFKASTEAYNGLDECCKYPRTAKSSACCADKTMTDGSCQEMASCTGKDCCKKI